MYQVTVFSPGQSGNPSVALLNISPEADAECVYQMVATELSVNSDQIEIFFNDKLIPSSPNVFMTSISLENDVSFQVRFKTSPPTNIISARTAQLQEIQKHRDQLNAANRNPYSAESQKFLENHIRQQRLDESLRLAQEHAPEIFHPVHMLCIEIKINDVKLRAMVDTGAQSTIMSLATIARCGLEKDMDTRFHGVAMGVGTSKILGRVHAVHFCVGDSHFASSVTVVENASVDFLFGLDVMRRYRCRIDLAKDEFIIGDSTVRFLGERDSQFLS